MNKDTVIKQSGATTKDALVLMKKQILLGIKDPYLQYISKQIRMLPRDQWEQAVFNFTYHSGEFERDPDDHQMVREARRTLNDRKANCVDYSVMIATLFKLLNIPFKFRLLAEDEKSGFVHIFVVTENNIKLDAILGRKGSNTEQWFTELPNGYFNFSVPVFYSAIDVKI